MIRRGARSETKERTKNMTWSSEGSRLALLAEQHIADISASARQNEELVHNRAPGEHKQERRRDELVAPMQWCCGVLPLQQPQQACGTRSGRQESKEGSEANGPSMRPFCRRSTAEFRRSNSLFLVAMRSGVSVRVISGQRLASSAAMTSESSENNRQRRTSSNDNSQDKAMTRTESSPSGTSLMSAVAVGGVRSTRSIRKKRLWRLACT